MNKQSEPIYVIVEHGCVHAITNIPEEIEIQVIDKDVEGEDEAHLAISPVDGDACTIKTFTACHNT